MNRSPLSGARAAALTRRLQAIADDPAMLLPGLSVAAVRAGEIVYTGHFGHKRLATASTPAAPVDDGTMFRIASVSKLVTALGVMKMIEQGVLALDADVGDYLGYRLRNPHFPAQPITLRMLLTHTASLRDDGGFRWAPDVDLKDVLLGGGAMWSAKHAPGSWFEYVNLNSGVIATVMEAASGERFDRLMRRLVFDPMALKAGFYLADFAPARVEDVATLYRRREKEGRERWDPQGPWIAQSDDFHLQPPLAPPGLERYRPGANGTLFGPQGGLRIGTGELARIMLMLMNGGRDGERQILRADTVSTMLARQWTIDEGVNGSGSGDGDSFHGLCRAWGLGNQHFVDASVAPGGRAQGDRLVEGGGFTGVGHLGWAWGLHALFVFDPATKDGMIYAASGVGADPDTQPGRFSSGSRFQERITDALYRGAILEEGAALPD